MCQYLYKSKLRLWILAYIASTKKITATLGKQKATYRQYSDEQLLQLYSTHRDSAYLGELLQRYTLLLLGVCMKYLKQSDEAKDAVQQVFTKVIQEVNRYPVAHFKSWIYTIARNHCLHILRQQAQVLPESHLDNYVGNDDNDWLHALQKARNKETLLVWLEEAVAQLPTHQQQCVSLFYLQKLSYRQISEQTGYTLLEVKSYIQNGKRNIKLMIEDKLKHNEA